MRWGKRKGFPPSHSLCSCWSALNIEVDYDDEDDNDDDDDDDNKNEVAKKCNINFCKILRIRNVQQQQCRSIWTYIYYCCSCCSSWGYLCPQGDAQTLSPLLYAPPPFTDSPRPWVTMYFRRGFGGNHCGTVDTLQQTLGQTGTQQKQMQLVNATTGKENKKTQEPSGRPHSIRTLQEKYD